jgi:hypothetical protein
MKTADVFIQETIQYKLTVPIEDGDTHEDIARNARHVFLDTEDGVTSSMIGVTERSFEVQTDNDSAVFDEDELSQEESCT